MGKKYFTPQEANALLPLLKEDLHRLQEAKRNFIRKAIELRQVRIRRQMAWEKVWEEAVFRLEAEMEFLQMEAGTLIESIRMKGAELKDIDAGLIDFPGIVEGEEVYLCWKLGEESVQYYHGINEGYRGRKPLPSNNNG